METEKKQINKKSLRYRFTAGTIGVLLTLGAVVVSTYAWYVYNTGRHTTKVRMAAGAGINLQISNAYDGVYGSAAVLDSVSGQLNPVSTNRISGGFQKVLDLFCRLMMLLLELIMVAARNHWRHFQMEVF